MQWCVFSPKVQMRENLFVCIYIIHTLPYYFWRLDNKFYKYIVQCTQTSDIYVSSLYAWLWKCAGFFSFSFYILYVEYIHNKRLSNNYAAFMFLKRAYLHVLCYVPNCCFDIHRDTRIVFSMSSTVLYYCVLYTMIRFCCTLKNNSHTWSIYVCLKKVKMYNWTVL